MKKWVLNIVYSGFVRSLLRLFIGVKFHQVENLKKASQFIIVANHNSHLDTAAIMSAIPGELRPQVHPVAAMDYFGRNKLMKWFSENIINTFLIQRKKEGRAGKHPIEQMVDALDTGKSLVLFPEGTRGEPEQMQDFRTGTGVVLSQRNKVPYIPVYIEGFGKSMPKGGKLALPVNCHVIFGEPVYCSSEDPAEITRQIQVSILSLKEGAEFLMSNQLEKAFA